METSEEFRTAEGESPEAGEARPDDDAPQDDAGSGDAPANEPDALDVPDEAPGAEEPGAEAESDAAPAESDEGEAESDAAVMDESETGEPGSDGASDDEEVEVTVTEDEETGDAILEVSEIVDVVDESGEATGIAKITETAEVDESGELTEVVETVDVFTVTDEGEVSEVVDTVIVDEEGVTEVVEVDEDGDGVPDVIEVAIDEDGDGVPDVVAVAIDEDGDGVPDVVAVAVDEDGDGEPDVVAVGEVETAEESAEPETAAAEEVEPAVKPATVAAAAKAPADGEPAPRRDPFGGPGDWYVVHTYAGYENKVKANLLSRIHSMQMEDKIFNVHIPMEDVLEIKGGKRQVVQRKVFPGYLLVKMFYDNDSWYVVRNTPGVTGFVSSGTGTKPTPLSKREVEKILAVKQETEAKPAFRLEFEEGDTVRIVSGPFADFNGTVSEINVDQSKLKVLVSIFDRETPVELGFDQVAKV